MSMNRFARSDVERSANATIAETKPMTMTTTGHRGVESFLACLLALYSQNMLMADDRETATASDGPSTAPVTLRITVDRGDDVGQSFGSLFEGPSLDRQFVIGAGFPNAYNTRLRADRHNLEFFVRPTEGPRSMIVDRLPRPTELCGTYLCGRDGKIYSTYGPTRQWDEKQGEWSESPSVGGTNETMRLGNGLLSFGDSEVYHNGRVIVHRPEQGEYQLFYYANGYLCFYHVDRGQQGYRPYVNDDDGFSRLIACRWSPTQDRVDLSQQISRTLPVVGETTFAWGQLGGQIVTGSNIGGFYVLEDGAWQMLLEPTIGVSFQLYSSVSFYDKLLMGQYPTGRLFSYDGSTISDWQHGPPVPPGVSGSAREAQTTVIYGGDLLVGVWPWGELWRLAPDRREWRLQRRMFDHPELTDKVVHPYERENAGHAVANLWGQRVTSMIPSGAHLFVATSAKAPVAWNAAEFPFLAPERWKAYGAVYRVAFPGHVSAPARWTDGPTTFEFRLAENRLTISQDGDRLAETTLPDAMANGVRSGLPHVARGVGIYGPFQGTLNSLGDR